jgi:small subunit ribosomal protein S17
MAEQATQDRQSTAQPPPLPAKYTRSARKTRVGEVISERMNKTIVVRTITRVPHPKFYAHDEENKAKTGDTVRIMETRPLSKLKRWRLVEVLQK